MFRRPARIAVLIVGLLLTIGAGYRAVDDDASLERERRDAATADAAVVKTSELLLDIRASLHAYVAPGQGLPFWAKRAQENIDNLHQSLVALDGLAAPAGRSLSESLDGSDQLKAAEQRARTHVSRGELQLAGDVIFTEVRDLLAAATDQVDSVRTDLKRHHDQRTAAIRAEQLMLVGGTLALWILIALFLAPTPAIATAKDPAEWRSELKETLAKPAPTPAALVPAPVVVPQAPIQAGVAVASVREVSEICADLSALSDPGALEGTLARVSSVLDATGLIVWLASNDGGSLTPVATHGFDPALVARIGRISRDSANLTASAFRENSPRISTPTTTAPAALAVAMCGPTGPAGVLSIELKAGQTVDEAKVALASIVAAQLATLTMPIPETQTEIEEPKRAAAI
jgi:hypothetical protein